MALITLKTGQLLCGKPFAFKSHHRCTLRPVCASRNESEITVSPTKTDEEAVLERDDISEGASNIMPLPSRLSLRTKRIKTIAKSRVKSRTLGLQEAMEFSGFGPDIVQGRLAMLGLIVCIAAEVQTDRSLTEQVGDSPVYFSSIGVAVAIASLIPILRGVDYQSAAAGPFSSEAEKLNGKLASIGLGTMLILETIYGTAMF